MDYLQRHTTFFPIVIWMMCGTNRAVLNTVLEENLADYVFSRHLESTAKSQLKSTTSCDFESLCQWRVSNHSSRDDWQTSSPQQPITITHAGTRRPIADHSLGSSQGHFLLLSPSSSAAEDSGSCVYHLSSQELPGSGELCSLQLAVFESGPVVGNLTLLVQHTTSSTPDVSVVIKQPGSRAAWEVVDAAIGRVDEPFQVTLLYSACLDSEAATLALDSLEFVDCDTEPLGRDLDCDGGFQCELGGCLDQSLVCDFHSDCPLGEDEGFICDALPLGSHCSFERDACGWSVSTQPTSWRRLTGQQMMETGVDPQGDGLRRTPGHFLFLRVQEGASSQGASVQSPTLPPPVSANTCQLRFSVYMFGEFNGTLAVSVETNGSSGPPLLWERHNQWAEEWQDVSLDLTGLRHQFSVRLSATWEAGSAADLALDDITLGAACFESDPSDLLLLDHSFFHDLEDSDGLFGPLQEPSPSEVSLMTWWFTSCGASGPRGPTQAQCDSAYRNTNVSVMVGRDGSVKGVQTWRVPATNRYMFSAYGAAGGKGAKNHNKRSHGVFISAIFPLEKGELLYILVGHQGEDACPGRNALTKKICLGESSVIEEELREEGSAEWAGGGGGGGGATYVFKVDEGELVPLLVAAGGGGKAYLEDPECCQDQVPLEKYEKDTLAPSTNGVTGAAGGGGGWRDSPRLHPWAGRSLAEGAEGGAPCPLALAKLSWSTFGGFGGGGGACTAGGGAGGYRGGAAALTDDITADGEDGVSFVHPMGEIFLHPLAVMESHGELEIKVQLNCSHCETQSCRRDEDTSLLLCLCHNQEVLAGDNVTCTVALQPAAPESQLSLALVLAVVASTLVSGVVLTCASLTLMYYRRKKQLHAARLGLQSPEYKLSKIRSSTIMTDYNPNYCFAGKAASLSELKEVPRRNITLLRALGHGAFGEVYEGQVLGISGDKRAMHVAIKTLPELCSEQDEMDFLMEALIMSKFSHQNIVRCIGVSLHILPRFILLELMTGGDLKSFLRTNRPRAGQTSSLSMLELLHMARDIAYGCRYLEENHFIHRDIAARNCLLSCTGPDRVAKIGDFGMARDIYRASYYRKGGRAMLPVKWMPPEAFMEGVFTCKTDTWSFGVLLWEILSLGYMPYPCKTNQEVLEFVTSGGRMDPPKACPGPVYRIMTQCWQHTPDHRPNFTSILERVKYCTQDPDVINTPLPVEYTPNRGDDGDMATRPADHTSSRLPPLLAPKEEPSLALGQSSTRAGVQSSAPLPQHLSKPRLHLPPPGQLPPQEAPEPAWGPRSASPAPGQPSSGAAGPCTAGSWLHPEAPLHLHHQPCSRTSSSSSSQKLKNKTKNLWNPTYGSWVLESFGRGRKTLAHTQSMPLSGSLPPAATSTSPGTTQGSCRPASDHAAPGGDASACTSSSASATSCLALEPAPGPASHKSTHIGGAAATGVPASRVVPPPRLDPAPRVDLAPRVDPIPRIDPAPRVDLAKLRSFTCGTVNYAYEEQCYGAESLPAAAPKAPVGPGARSAPVFSSSSSCSSFSFSSSVPKLLLKRHASYGHEDVKRHGKAEKTIRDRDSGFSLSEDLSVTPV
ncbi:unnamed protein product [Boreogadus saida]